jgi:nucleoporin p58/p45
VSGTPAAAATTTGGGLFGSNTATTTTIPASTAGGGLFGNSNTTTQPAATGSGLFGSGAATSSSTGGGLFGNPTTIAQPAAGGGMFSGTGLNVPKPATGGGLFGNNTIASQPASTGGGLFGNNLTTTNQQASTGGGLFGNSTATNQQQSITGGGLFGNTASTNQQQNQQQTVPAVRVDASNIKGTTRFSELHEEVQALILQIDGIVQASIEKSYQCSEAMPALGATIESLPADVELLETKLETVDGALSRDARAVGASKEVINADALDALKVFRAVENLKLPAQFHYSSIGGGFNSSSTGEEEGSTDLLPYFSTTTNKLTKDLDEYQRVVVEVESHLRTVESSAVEGIQKVVRRRQMMGDNGNGGQVDARKEGLRELAGTMRGFEEAVLRVAGRVGEAREGVVELGMGMGRR